jgi:tetratricopeptide (TPR) repeat protein
LELPDDVVSFIVTEMKKLSADLLFGLKVAACIGRMTSDVIDILSAELTAAFTGTTLADILHKLAQKGFLTEHVCSRKTECCATSSGSLRFEFVHDKIQEAAYEFMSSQEQRLNHMRFGLALYPQAINKSNDELLFMAINQINVAGPESIVDGDQKHIIAGLNLNAGKRAGERSDYQTAFSLFQHGMSYLEADCWTNHYGTSIELFDSAAQAAVVVNDLEAVTLYCNTVNSRAKCFDDKLNCIRVKLKALIHGERYEEAMGYFLEIVKDFGEPALLPMHEIQEDMKAMNFVMKGLADETLLSLSTMKQKKTIALVKIYCDFSDVLIFIDPSLVPSIALRCMQLTVQEGLCSKSPIVFALYAKSLSLSGTSNDIGESVRFGRFSKTLQERMGSSDCGSLNEMVYYVMGLAQPFQALTEEFKLSKKTGEQSGDIFNAVASYCVICLLSYITGEHLTYVRRKSIDCIVQMKEQNMIAFLGLQALLHSQLVALIDGPQIADAESVDDVIFGEKKALAAAGKDNFEALSSYEANQLVRAFLYRKFDILSSSTFFETISDPAIPNEPVRVMTFFFAGLASFHLAREAKAKEEEKKWMKIGDTLLEKMECWNKFISWNFENKMLLLKAEKMYCLGETESAASLYEQSIKSAHDHKFIHEEGVSHELCGHFHLEMGHRSEALESFNSSVQCYINWGALAVARRLEVFVKSTFCSESL